MTQHTILVTRAIDERVLDFLKSQDDVDVRLWNEDRPIDRDALLERITDVDGVLTMLTERVDAELLDHAPQLKVISNMAVGYDNIDVNEATSRGLPVGNTPGVLTETSADLAFALLMSAARRLPEAQAYVNAGKWQTWSPNLLLGRDVYGATLGIVGLGRIGQAVARRGKAFGMKVIYYGGSDKAAAQEIGAEERTLSELLQESDFVSLHVPLREDTYHYIGAEELAQMKSTAILINTARGGVVDPQALYEALKNGSIYAAALDVTEPEPINPDDPLLTLDNCLIVPHIGSSSVETRRKMAQLAAENVLAGVRGERLPNCVNPEVYE